ncbi:MAG: DUF6291 domain-containing protein [Atopobium sp.]|uniref:DUF6291 domain-containing protein n=1 Tax=Atopobium sp. TaxID=1872650 RepID=UPI002A7F5282|nr:DUF6291 domain-containing protein [Atopobium sp.]MDY4523085.1 DUF6291 domain-containing protein [Atopobium sp.]
MVIYDSLIEGAQELTAEQQGAFYKALVDYIYFDTEPEVEGIVGGIFTMVKPTLEKYKKRSSSGRAGGSKQKAQKDTEEANETSTVKQNDQASASKPLSKTTKQVEANDISKSKQTVKQNDQASASKTQKNEEAIFDSSSYSSSCSFSSRKGGMGGRKSSFFPPTVEEVQAYCDEKGYADVDPQSFVSFYAAKDWYIGKNKMKNWRAACTNWHVRNMQNRSTKPTPTDFSQYANIPFEVMEA